MKATLTACPLWVMGYDGGGDSEDRRTILCTTVVSIVTNWIFEVLHIKSKSKGSRVILLRLKALEFESEQIKTRLDSVACL